MSRTLLIASLVLFLASLTQNGFCLLSHSTNECNGAPGWSLVALGWLQILVISEVGPFVALAWLANPFLVAAWTCLLSSRRTAALVLAAISGLLALSFLLGRSAQISEGGGPDPITSYGAGYWLWLGSIGLAFLSAVLSPGSEPPRSS
jgi:hypothetical protein